MDIEKKIFQIAEEIKEFDAKINSLQELDYDKLHEYSKQIFLLKYKLQQLEAQSYLERKPDCEGEDIDLYVKNVHVIKEENPDQLCFFITKHNTKELVGTVDVRFKLLKSERYLGNIGAEIDKEYRGQRYSKKAFMLLRDIMLEHGLTKPIFTVRETNSSSIKSLENIGANRIEYVADAEEPYYIYEYNLIEENRKNK